MTYASSPVDPLAELLPSVQAASVFPNSSSQQPARSFMKIRPATCIHVAAYLFSALVLGTSALSHHRWIDLRWCLSGTATRLVAYEGKCCVRQTSHLKSDYYFDMKMFDPFTFGVLPGVLVGAGSERQNESLAKAVHFPGGLYFAFQDRETEPLRRYWVFPCSWFLIPPIIWMCSFHLLRIRRRWRATSSKEQIQS